MKQSEAVRLVGLVNAYYPGKELPTETIALWATEIAPYELDDALKAVRDLCVRTKYQPALSEILEEIRIVQRARIEREARALPAVTEGDFIALDDYLKDNPNAQEVWRKFRQRFGRKAEEGATR